LDREARRACFGAVSAAEVDGISAAGQAATRYGPSQTGKEDLIVPGYWHGSHPRISDRVKVVEVQEALGEKVIFALGTARLYEVPPALKEMFPLVKSRVTPLLGTP
jgi:hypothetical protein